VHGAKEPYSMSPLPTKWMRPVPAVLCAKTGTPGGARRAAHAARSGDLEGVRAAKTVEL